MNCHNLTFFQRLDERTLIVCLGGACLKQAMYNKSHAYSNCVIVVGSLGIGTEAPFYKYGGGSFTSFADYRNSPYTKLDAQGSLKWDVHAWLEDHQGNVYDIVTLSMLNCAVQRDKQLLAEPLKIIAGKIIACTLCQGCSQ